MVQFLAGLRKIKLRAASVPGNSMQSRPNQHCSTDETLRNEQKHNNIPSQLLLWQPTLKLVLMPPNFGFWTKTVLSKFDDKSANLTPIFEFLLINFEKLLLKHNISPLQGYSLIVSVQSPFFLNWHIAVTSSLLASGR